MSKPPKLEEVSAERLREMFNSGGYWDQVREGDLTTRLLADRHPALPKAGEPVCTRSQIVAYYDLTGKRIALVHQYLRKNGKLGASGRPDPKRLRVGDIIYYTAQPPS